MSIYKKFTLIELLIVISIITILAAMLLPALSRARDVARSSACVANMKNISYAATMYCDTYQDRFWYSSGKDSGGPAWELLLAQMINPSLTTSSPIDKYWFCPSDPVDPYGKKNVRVYDHNIRGHGGYGYNSYCLPTVFPSPRRLVKWPSRKFFILDSSKEYVNPRTMTAIASAGASLSYSVNGNYHNSGANAIYLDGHVERNKDFYFKRSKALWTMNYY